MKEIASFEYGGGSHVKNADNLWRLKNDPWQTVTKELGLQSTATRKRIL